MNKEELFKNIAFLDEKDAFEKLDKNKELRDWFLVELNASLQRSENVVANLEDRRKLRCYKNAVTSLQVENQELKKELEEKNKPQIFIDTQDIEERYAEGLYQDYLEEENKKYKNQQKEFIEYLENEKNIYPYDISDYTYEDIINTILSKYYEIIEK